MLRITLITGGPFELCAGFFHGVTASLGDSEFSFGLLTGGIATLVIWLGAAAWSKYAAARATCAEYDPASPMLPSSEKWVV